VDSRVADSSRNRLTLLGTARSTRRERRAVVGLSYSANSCLSICSSAYRLTVALDGTRTCYGSVLTVALLDVCRVARCSVERDGFL